MAATELNSVGAILSRALWPAEGNLSPVAAKFLLDLRLEENDVQRAQVLNAKARENTLIPLEEAELDNYCSVGRLLELLKSKARLSLGNAG